MNNKGFTLIEILVAILIFTVGAIVVARLQITSVRPEALSARKLWWRIWRPKN